MQTADSLAPKRDKLETPVVWTTPFTGDPGCHRKRRLGRRRTPNREPRPEGVRHSAEKRGTYHPLPNISKFTIRENQNVPDVVPHTLPVVYAATHVNGDLIHRPNRGQYPYP
jgi:hypothetical protein